MSNRPLAVVLISGGMDSALCTALAIEDGYEVAALHLNYKQRTESRELQSFRDLLKHYDIKKQLVIDSSHLALIGGSSLTDTDIPISAANLEVGTIPTSYVPFRNASILSMAVSWAEVLSASVIYIGAVEADGSGYPDCREIFFDAFRGVISLGTKPDTNIKLVTPLIQLSKRDIVLLGTKLSVPFHLTWSCYKNNIEACGECDSCALRLRGFNEAGIEDPIPYAKHNQ